MRLTDGTVVPRDALAVATRMVARGGFLAALGLRAVEHPTGVGEYIPSDAGGRTDVPGVWVAGNATDLMAQVGAAASGGATAAGQINADLIEEETRQAVAAHAAVSRGLWAWAHGCDGACSAPPGRCGGLAPSRPGKWGPTPEAWHRRTGGVVAQRRCGGKRAAAPRCGAAAAGREGPPSAGSRSRSGDGAGAVDS